ncbi:CLIP-associated protein isoform X2 [Amborella trichopoda]|uniref:CLIP-associated protein isoform X2 n=1 Tax=Amborella trichopoda TaxID=13333 RepID=UPI0009C07821|nr:CLIP-associated protein isoform X2 [Amborella trichopoda]|eukprot:XP_020529249.1 CLIP-associated protein isoform X2 [Amborella trichopoda]
MEEALEMAQAKDTKERMAGVELLQQHLENCRKPLPAAQVTQLVDCCMDLLKDNNFRVSQGALQALTSAAVLSGEHLKLHFNALLPAAVERLGDAKQPVRDAARRLLIALMQVSSPTIIVERAGSYGWTHKSWRVREEFARTVSSAIHLFAATELPFQRVLLAPVLQLLNDSNNTVREAAASCIEEMYMQVGPQFRDELQRHHLPSSMVKEINARLEKLEPKVRASDGRTTQFGSAEMKPAVVPTFSQKKSSPKTKSVARETSVFGGESDVAERPMDPVKVYSEKELVREFEKIASTLVPEQDWSVRIAAMQRVEGLVFGGATDYPSFTTLLKQLVGPLSIQLSDRRSSIVKQACHLLCLLSKELLGDFEACAEVFIPVLFKLVVITVLVIAESADNCIKTMLRNCKVARVLPRIADFAKHDRSAVLRARCCEYALLILEYWADAPEIQRSADLYEDLIKCCVADAMSEVRSTARTCYRMFTKTWPERSRRLFLSFDPVIQRIINEEDGGIHRRYASPSLRERGVQQLRVPSQPPALSNLPGYGTSAIVAMDRSASIAASGPSLSSGSALVSQMKPQGKGTERSLESVLQASKQQVSAIESMLRGLDISEKQNSLSTSCPSSLDLGVDPPSARDPPLPAAVPASNHLTHGSGFSNSAGANIAKGSIRNGTPGLTDLTSQLPASKEHNKLSYLSNLASDPLSTLSYTAKRVPISSERSLEISTFEDNVDIRPTRRISKSDMYTDRHFLETSYRDVGSRDSQNHHIPNFQRPLLRKHVAGRASASGRASFDDGQFPIGEMSHYTDGPTSLIEALTEGLSPSSDWNARVSAFNYVRSLLQQGAKGTQEILQSFEKVMKLFFQHLDDPHHKVAQAALSTLAELVPACRKPFESYLERILPHVFSRLIDPKELVRQPCSTALEIVGNTYSIDSLLPALLRSLDEQRSPKAKLAVIEFAISSFDKLMNSSEGAANSGMLKLWLAKVAPLVNDKNPKLKEAAITSIISVYSHYDSISVLNFILGLSVEEQNALRRALKQYTPRIEVDLMNFLQMKKERTRSKSYYDQQDVVGTSSEEGYVVSSKKSHFFGRYSSGSIDSDGGRKWSSMQESIQIGASIAQTASDEPQDQYYPNFEAGSNTEDVLLSLRNKDSKNSVNASIQRTGSWDGKGALGDKLDSEVHPDGDQNHEKAIVLKINCVPESGPSIPQVLHQICNGNDEESSVRKNEALQLLLQVSRQNNPSVWTKYFNQILTAVLEILDDPDSSIRELALSLIVEMLNNQKETMEDSVEIVLEKLLHATRDVVPKVSSEADHCLTIVLSQYDSFRCLTVVVPLLVSEDEKMLVTCINCLTKLVGRLSQEELMGQLPSFLPALFDAFGNQSADVRKTVVFCLVDIYIVLGKAFLPYLGGLSSTQLRLVTIYANRISQARTGTAIDGNQV